MKVIRYSLLSEGSSDRALLPILTWAIRQKSTVEILPEWADLRSLHEPPSGLADRIAVALDLYPCDLLFVHRDADLDGRESRLEEIKLALSAVPSVPAVCVIPVRCLEAWFLFSETAIRFAAGNPNGSTPLDLPKFGPSVEHLTNPKQRLHEAIRTASELSGRRRRRVNPGKAVHRISRLVRDFSPLRQLPAFRALEHDVQQILGLLDI